MGLTWYSFEHYGGSMFHKMTPNGPRMRTRPMTREQARDEFTRQGITIREWAKEHGLPERTVYEVLAGRKKGVRGDAHRAAVLLGIKDGVIV